MVKINEILFDETVICATYEEGPFHFDEWYSTVKCCYPNLNQVICSNNELEELCCDAEIIDCSNNLITRLECVNAHTVNCNSNELRELTLPQAETIYC
jgi:hypothetical protein